MTSARRHSWQPAEEELLRELYPQHDAAEIAARLGVSAKQVLSKAHNMGLRKPREWIAERARMRALDPQHPMRAHQFQPGHSTWNTGKPGSTGLHQHTQQHWFRPGHKPHTWRPIGTHRMVSGGVLQVKVSDTGYPPRDWVSVARLVWEQANGPVPAGHVVRFRDGMATQQPELVTLDRLECVSRAENMRRNSVHRHGGELASVAQLRGAITRQINKRLREQQGQTP